MLVAPSPARARPERFIDVAAAPSGGAWVLVELDDPRVTGWKTEIRRAGVEEQVGVEQVPTATRIMAIASDRDGTLWLLTLDEVLRRDARGRWARAGLPPDPLVKRDDRSLIRNGEIQPIAPGRALVVRLCPARGAEKCSDVFEVEMATGQVTSQRLGVRLDRPIADGRGGAWVTIPGWASTARKSATRTSSPAHGRPSR